jgi:hypothetical protein
MADIRIRNRHGIEHVIPAALWPVAQRQGATALDPIPANEAPALALAAPFADYDSLNAAQVIARLASMDASHRAAVYAYEAANKKRKTILEASGDSA